MAYWRYVKPAITCTRCGKENCRPVREIYCKNCATILVRKGILPKIVGIDTPLELTSYQEQILTGLMLGDGCLYRHKPTYLPHLCIIRSQEDRDYLWDNYNVFKEFCKSPPRDASVYDKRTNNITYHSKFASRNCKVFDGYYNTWYPDEKKIVPRSLKLTPLVLAIFFCDDGYLRIDYINSYVMQLSTECFVEEDVHFLKQKIESTFDVVLTISKNLRLHAYGKSAQKICNIIDPYISDSMARKAIWRNHVIRKRKNWNHSSVAKEKMSAHRLGKHFTFISPNGEKIVPISIHNFALKYGLNEGSLRKLMRCQIQDYKGWKIFSIIE